MKSPLSRFNHLPAHLLRYLRGHSAARPQPQVEHWLDELVAATPDDDELLDPEQEAQRRARILEGVRARTRPSGRVLSLWPTLRVAAVIVPLLVAGAVLWHRGQQPELLHYATGVGEQREVVLPDSSHVWLRPRSELTCVASFGAVRRVQLRGEAFFSVTKDPAHPFVVQAGEVAVKVLGTSFLVQAYPQLPATTVLVHTGRVQVAHQQRVLGVLHPHDQLQYHARTGQLTLTSNNYTAALPTRQLLTFEQASLPDILFQLENYYPVHFTLRRPAPTVALTGTLDPSLSADQITDVLNVLLQRHQLRITKLSATAYQVE
ncbi:FecR domain-containing protein [Hymenobacter sp. HSC-4F20]|uniref:FecR family protein n=1 Tax=Hymenobacter sp. HSC-4F20 TaxID=2864135 RepID=UPI001C730587|nr:FecR domain-containing protein [Hymenobacter sp. HSC-4F20]MBX0293056.1 FecR domain-containing protein [Hymenobacter sp. HSC-4F20]